MKTPKEIAKVKYDWNHNGLIPEIVDKINEIIEAVNDLSTKKEKDEKN